MLHASHNPAKKMLDWDYVIEILHIDLRKRLADWRQAQTTRNLLSDEGSLSQDPGGSHAPSLPSALQTPGGDHHV